MNRKVPKPFSSYYLLKALPPLNLVSKYACAQRFTFLQLITAHPTRYLSSDLPPPLSPHKSTSKCLTSLHSSCSPGPSPLDTPTVALLGIYISMFSYCTRDDTLFESGKIIDPTITRFYNTKRNVPRHEFGHKRRKTTLFGPQYSMTGHDKQALISAA